MAKKQEDSNEIVGVLESFFAGFIVGLFAIMCSVVVGALFGLMVATYNFTLDKLGHNNHVNNHHVYSIHIR